MGILNAVQAGHYLGFTDKTVRAMVKRGELHALSLDPVRLDSRHVDDVLRARQADALRDLARVRQSPVGLARETLRVLRPAHESKPLPDRVAERQRLRLSLVPDMARVLFGRAALTAALVEDGSCRWCKAREYAAVFQTWAPEQYSEGVALLFGQEPCTACAASLYTPLMESLRARVNGGAGRPSRAAVVPSAAERQAAQEWVRQRPVTASAQPVRDDNGKALVARRLREARARLKAAKRSGDQRYALKLAAVVRSLEADAARVDGRVPSAADRPGTLRCGHALAAGCSCPRRSQR